MQTQEQIMDRLKDLGIKRTKIAKIAEVSPATITNWMKGHTEMSISQANKIVNFFNL